MEKSSVQAEEDDTIINKSTEEFPESVSDDLLDVISEVRSELRANKQYDLSDKIRDNLQALGYEIND